MTIDYSVCGNFADYVRAFAIVESSENPDAIGDNSMARGLLQIHPSQFSTYYGRSKNFPESVHDTWLDADMKTCAAFLDMYIPAFGLDRTVMAWNLGVGAISKGATNPDYLAKWNAALNEVVRQKNV